VVVEGSREEEGGEEGGGGEGGKGESHFFEVLGITQVDAIEWCGRLIG